MILTFLLVVAPESLIPGDPGVEEAQWVLRDVLFSEQLVVANDFGQRQRLQHVLGEGLHGVDEHLICRREQAGLKEEVGPGTSRPGCPTPSLLRDSGQSQGSPGPAEGQRGQAVGTSGQSS